MLSATAEINLLDLDREEYSDTLAAVVEKISTRKGSDAPEGTELGSGVSYTLQRLNQFLGYLTVFHGMPELTVEPSAGLRCGQGVRANLVTMVEFQRLKKYLGWGNPDRSRRMTLVAAILAFRAGLRAAEIQFLLIGDVQGTDCLEVLVRPNRLRALKTESSRRRIPLYALAPKEELDFVREWHRFRSDEWGATAASPLFTSGPGEILPCSRGQLLDPLITAAKQVTGDQTMVLHSLRHSFASWLLTGFLLREGSPMRTVPAFLEGEEWAPARIDHQKDLLLANEKLGRKILYATGCLLGHADTQTEIQSYMHLCDWLLWHHLRHPACAPPLTAAALAALAGIPLGNATWHLRKKENPLEGLVSKQAKDHRKSLGRPREEEVSEPNPVQKPKIEKQRFPAFDEASQRVIKNPTESGQKKVLTPNHLKVLQALYDRVAESGLHPRAVGFSAKRLLAGFRDHEGAFWLENLHTARNIGDLLRALGITFAGRFSPSRWIDENHEENRKAWEAALGVPVGKGASCAGKKYRQGMVRLFVVDLAIMGQLIEADKQMFKLLKNALEVLKTAWRKP
ncbi:MAG: site-specific integrase [Deltaproteobacteria bacterium]|nr:site-specific integrase [Deltaproteobacteria bacterium]